MDPKTLRVTKNHINRKIVVQLRLCEKVNGILKPTNQFILLNLNSVDMVIKSLQFIKVLEGDICGKS